jgi:hypothetical protein
MKMNRWSEHEKYIVMIDGNAGSIKGVRLGYQAFLDFKRVKDALIAMSKNDSNYSYDGDIYSRVITSSRASQILEKIEDCRWDDDIRTVAKQIKAGYMLSPYKKFSSLNSNLHLKTFYMVITYNQLLFVLQQF